MGGNDKAVSVQSHWLVGPGEWRKALFLFDTRKIFVAFILKSEAIASQLPARGRVQSEAQRRLLPHPIPTLSALHCLWQTSP